MLVSALRSPESPYRGIEPFRYIDWQIFSAREDEVLNLLSTIIVSRGVLVYGESGTGKSSLINAGLVPVALENDLLPVIIRVQPQAGAEIVVDRIATTEAGPPYLDSVLVNNEETSARAVLSLEDFMERLSSRASLSPSQAFPEDLFPEQAPRTLLIFDQFEEVITLFEDSRGNTIEQSSETQERILNSMISLLRDQSLAIKLVLVFREDYLAKLKTRFKRQPDFASQYMHVLPLRAEGLLGIIRAPFEKLNFAKELSPQLAEEIASEMRNEGDEINLSEVQIVCQKLWEAPNPEALFQDRGIKGLIEDFLTEELSEFSGAKSNLAIGLLGLMLTASNTRNIISGVDLIKLYQREEDVPDEQLKEALRSLTNTRLVRREYRNSAFFYEITSEFLVPWIIQRKAERQSRLERLKLEKERELELERERERASNELRFEQERATQRLKFEQEKASERLKFEQEKASQRLELEQKLAQKKIFYWRLGSLVFAVIMLLLLGVSAKINRDARAKAELQQQVIQAQEGAATEQALNKQIIDILTQLFKTPPPQALVSDAKLKFIKSKLAQDKLGGINLISSLLKENQFPPEDVPTLVGPALTTGNANPEITQAAQALLEQARKAKDDADALKKRMGKDKLDAIHQMGDLMEKEKFPRELVLSLLSPTLTAKESDPDVAKAVSTLIVTASAANNEVGQFIDNAAANDSAIAERLPPRVYILIESGKQTEQANTIKTALENIGYIVPTTEIVDIRAPRRYELRYYRRDDEKKISPIVDLLKTLNLDLTTVYLKGHEQSTQIRPSHFELWFAAQSKRGEDWYVIVRYAPATKENRTLVENFIAPFTETEGGTSKPISARELSVGPYPKEQAENVRQQLSENSINLIKKIGIIRH